MLVQNTYLIIFSIKFLHLISCGISNNLLFSDKTDVGSKSVSNNLFPHFISNAIDGKITTKEQKEHAYSDQFNMNISIKEQKEHTHSDPRTAHYQPCETAYWEYMKSHSGEFSKGEYVSVILGDPIARGFKNYQDMACQTRAIAKGRRWWFTEFGFENAKISIYSTM